MSDLPLPPRVLLFENIKTDILNGVCPSTFLAPVKIEPLLVIGETVKVTVFFNFWAHCSEYESTGWEILHTFYPLRFAGAFRDAYNAYHCLLLACTHVSLVAEKGSMKHFSMQTFADANAHAFRLERLNTLSIWIRESMNEYAHVEQQIVLASYFYRKGELKIHTQTELDSLVKASGLSQQTVHRWMNHQVRLDAMKRIIQHVSEDTHTFRRIHQDKELEYHKQQYSMKEKEQEKVSD